MHIGAMCYVHAQLNPGCDGLQSTDIDTKDRWISILLFIKEFACNHSYLFLTRLEFRCLLFLVLFSLDYSRKLTSWPGLLEAWLVLTSVKYHGNLYILIPLNQRLALTRLRATGPWTLTGFKPMASVLAQQCSTNWAMKTGPYIGCRPICWVHHKVPFANKDG